MKTRSRKSEGKRDVWKCDAEQEKYLIECSFI